MKFDDLDMGDKKALIDKARKRYERAYKKPDARYDILIMFTSGRMERIDNARFMLPASEDSRLICIEKFDGENIIIMEDKIDMMRYIERED